MKRLVVLAGLLSALAASLPAQAQPGERPGRFERIQQRDAQQQREFRREQELQRRQLQRHEHENRRERMTPEERQQLRRDIRERGRDVYRDRPRRF